LCARSNKSLRNLCKTTATRSLHGALVLRLLEKTSALRRRERHLERTGRRHAGGAPAMRHIIALVLVDCTSCPGIAGKTLDRARQPGRRLAA
jgi:hypothetical protein